MASLRWVESSLAEELDQNRVQGQIWSCCNCALWLLLPCPAHCFRHSCCLHLPVPGNTNLTVPAVGGGGGGGVWGLWLLKATKSAFSKHFPKILLESHPSYMNEGTGLRA